MWQQLRCFCGGKAPICAAGHMGKITALLETRTDWNLWSDCCAFVGRRRRALLYIDSNDITAFTIFDTGEGTVSSYYFDTRKPESEVVKFDEFKCER